MDFLTAYAIYATGVILLVGMFALRVPREDVRIVFLLGAMWPVSFLAIICVMLMNATGWDVDTAKGTKMFGFRKPTNPKMKGFAVTIFFGEIQFWKVNKG